MLPISFGLLVLLSCCAAAAATTSQDPLKLPLRRAGRAPSLPAALALDSLRLSILSPNTSALSAPVVSGAVAGSGQYYVTLRLGTPAQRLRLVADTGSDLVWSRCSPCRGPACPLRHPPLSSYLPRRSSSFSPIHCRHPSCRLIPHSPCRPRRSRRHTPCRYRYSYSDNSSSAGLFSHDVANAAAADFSLQFGCAFSVSSAAALPGVLGLGRGPVSFASQAARRLRLPDRFSYCLADLTLAPPLTSYLLIGASHKTAAPRLHYTPLESNPLSPTFYYVRVLGAQVDGAELDIDQAVWALDRASGGGGTIVDSGTTLSFVPAQAYRKILKSMRRRLPRSAVLHGPPGFDLCVNSSLIGSTYPRLRFRLLGGVDMAPPPGNYFVDAAEGVRCLAVQPVAPSPAGVAGFGVIGNLMQQGFLFVFDRAAGRLGLSWTGCGAAD